MTELTPVSPVASATVPLTPKLRGWLHAGIFPLALAAGIVLICLAPSDGSAAACTVFAVSSWLLFGVSGIYHTVNWNPRVKAVLRRFERPSAPSVISFEEVVIDASAMQLKVRGELTTTTATEFRLLDYLARHPGRVFSRDHLLDAVWGDARFVTPRSVDVYVRRIREKIEIDPENPRYLKTVRGAGYRFELPKGE